MWLIISLGMAVAGGLIAPFCLRLHCTGLWLGKVLVDPIVSKAMPNGLQDAVTSGWPSSLVACVNIFRFAALGVAFLHAWWAPVLAFILGSWTSAFVSKTQLAPIAAERYIGIFMVHALRRRERFSARGDTERAQLTGDLASSLEEILVLYLGQGVDAPDFTTAREAPFGDASYLLRHAASSSHAAPT
ncbi:hypothetical protein HRD49_07660 [Corallococcus exiguus]|uniref:hypothetical protein n=1 Tax=Corallococcus exiguus TaxID=83462 RepID=UPI0011E5EC68|nr:hypothetical protein [Corallococcus exiguus]NRD61627.1 hypothetical protein [Corallococcus exiguus]